MFLHRLADFLNNGSNQDFFEELKKREEFSINDIGRLKQKYPHAPVAELITLIKLQRKNAKKIPFSSHLIFDSKGIEQASSWRLAEYHAEKTKSCSSVADLCCGIGIDLLALSKSKKKVFAVDIDEEKLFAASYNSAYFKRQNIFFKNQTAEDFSEPVEAIFIDPDRRNNQRRKINPEEYKPALSKCLNLIKVTPNIMIKLSPVIDFRSLSIPVTHSFEFIQENGSLKEILLCLGEFANPKVNLLAIDLNSNSRLTSADIPDSTICPIKRFIFEPNAAIIRAGLVQQCAFQTGYKRINEHLALLTGEPGILSIFGKTYEVITIFPYQKKRLQSYFDDHSIGIVDIKTRGFPITVEVFRKMFKLQGDKKIILFLLRHGQGYLCVITKELKKKLA